MFFADLIVTSAVGFFFHFFRGRRDLTTFFMRGMITVYYD